jgi:hypothetical protein
MDELALRTWTAARRSGRLKPAQLNVLWPLLDWDSEARAERAARGFLAGGSFTKSLAEVALDAHIDERTAFTHLSSLKEVDQIQMSLRDKRLKTYDFWIRHAPPRPAHLPGEPDPQLCLSLGPAEGYDSIGPNNQLPPSTGEDYQPLDLAPGDSEPAELAPPDDHPLENAQEDEQPLDLGPGDAVKDSCPSVSASHPAGNSCADFAGRQFLRKEAAFAQELPAGNSCARIAGQDLAGPEGEKTEDYSRVRVVSVCCSSVQTDNKQDTRQFLRKNCRPASCQDAADYLDRLEPEELDWRPILARYHTVMKHFAARDVLPDNRTRRFIMVLAIIATALVDAIDGRGKI